MIEPVMRTLLRRMLVALLATAAISCSGGSTDPGPGPGPVLPEPFPDCPIDRICTFTLSLQRYYTPAYESTLDKFDYVITNGNGVSTGLTAAVSPDVPILLYEPLRFRLDYCNGGCDDWVTVDAHDEWFWHDALGNRVQYENQPAWFMDYRNTDYLDYLVGRFLWLKTQHPEIDGFFMDQNGPYRGFMMFSVPAMNPDTLSPLPTESEFDQYNVAANEHVKSRIGSLHMVLNSNSYPGFNGQVDGSMDEGFVKDNFGDDTEYLPEPYWTEAVARLADPSAAGKFLFPYTKSIGSAEAPRIRRYGLASYLLGRRVDGYAFYCFQADTDTLPQWFPEYETPTGAPLGTYYQDTTGLWVREFENGFAVVHADKSAGDLTFSLPGGAGVNYLDWDGVCSTGSVVVPTNTGHFFLRTNCTP
jgi:hypothetical protein